MKKIILLLSCFIFMIWLLSCNSEGKGQDGTTLSTEAPTAPTDTDETPTAVAPTDTEIPTDTELPTDTEIPTDTEQPDDTDEYKPNDLHITYKYDYIALLGGTYLSKEDSDYITSILNNGRWVHCYYMVEPTYTFVISDRAVGYYWHGVFRDETIHADLHITAEQANRIKEIIRSYSASTENFVPEGAEPNPVPEEPDKLDPSVLDEIKKGMPYNKVMEIVEIEGICLPRRTNMLVYVWILTDGNWLYVSFIHPNSEEIDNMSPDDLVVNSALIVPYDYYD